MVFLLQIRRKRLARLAGNSENNSTASPASPPAPEPLVKEPEVAPMDQDEKSVVMRSQSSVRFLFRF